MKMGQWIWEKPEAGHSVYLHFGIVDIALYMKKTTVLMKSRWDSTSNNAQHRPGTLFEHDLVGSMQKTERQQTRRAEKAEGEMCQFSSLAQVLSAIEMFQHKGTVDLSIRVNPMTDAVPRSFTYLNVRV